MSFCKFSSELVVNNKTNIDNIFITDYMCDAPEYCVKVYLLGLYFCHNPNEDVYNTISYFESKLNMSAEDVISAFMYWKEIGLVQVIETSPLEIRYMPISYGTRASIKINEDKYSDFISIVTELIKGREISKTELYEYCDTMDRYHIEPDAMILVIEYCIKMKKQNVGYRYIISVARNWANEGYNTREKIEEKLNGYEKISVEITDFAKQAGIKSVITIEHQDLYKKWLNIGFTSETLFYIAKLHKSSKKKTNFDKLDAFIMKCYEMQIMSNTEIDDYLKQKEILSNLAKTVCKNLGVYYENLDPVVENYISKWNNLGFDTNLIENFASYCFKNSIRTLELMDKQIQKFYKLGITTQESLNQYLVDILKVDEQIQEILNKLNLVRNVNSYDRECYKTWTMEWNFSDDIIDHATTIAKGKPSAMAYLNKVLSNYKNAGVDTLEKAKVFVMPLANVQNQKFENHEYSKEQLSKLFIGLEEVDL